MSELFDCSDFKATNLVDLLRHRASYQPEERAFTFLHRGETEAGCLSYGDLDRRARAIAAQLQRFAIAGDRVLLLYPPGLEFIAAFFGCLYAAAIAVPAYPPRPRRPLSRARAIVADAQATVVLSTGAVQAKLAQQLATAPELAGLHWLATDQLPDSLEALASVWEAPAIASDSLAFLQYTSGSTGTPKGVIISHANLLHNQCRIQHAFGQGSHTIGVGWLPLFHDMGLIGKVIQPVYLGIPCTLMSPIDFLQRPIRWLRAISHYRATTSGAPNFAYDLCVRKITAEQRQELDLSSWEVAFNSAEPIRAETLERFAAAFEPCGFRREAFYPCYGLAETTLFATGGDSAVAPIVCTVEAAALSQNRVVPVVRPAAIGENHSLETATPETAMFEPDSPETRTLVSCGFAWLGDTAIVVDPVSRRVCEAGQVGEIWLAGPSVARGYWNRPQETQHYFQAVLAETSQGPFLRTGDLGFVQDGQVFVTGRLKDVMIIKGQNHYPQDVEQTVAQCHPAFRPEGSAAFVVDARGEERLVVLQEVERSAIATLDGTAALDAIAEAVMIHHDLPLYAALLLKPGSLPKTSSGKIQRHHCRSQFLDEAWIAIAAIGPYKQSE